ncbi:hypothetical protein DID88_004162 [Monilinia fructigena]|uniref:SHSP domain-containing protein n=1 Tax=Monilinia fructigena TaxID=38457 RepID=A0A395IRY4_9HELO|nr:hypothetical protein DID88_004162 [Monilinia fructigena]
MAFFPRHYISNEASSFHPLFRLLDDFDQYSSGRNSNSHQHRSSNVIKTFTPKFDVKEVGEIYELHGELPGIEQKDVEIEFIDDQTLNIRGRTERSYTSGTPPAGFVEDAHKSGAITEGGETSEHKDKSHQPTVEDEDATPSSAETSTEVTKATAQKQPQEPEHKYWVSERSVGEFSRSFSFPVRVNQDAVQASMKNGILSIVVPKAKKQESRKITIQ